MYFFINIDDVASSPQVKIAPEIQQYLGKNFGIWHTMINVLEVEIPNFNFPLEQSASFPIK